MSLANPQLASSEERRASQIDSEPDCISYSFGDIDNYQIVSRIGRGKYSTVYSGKKSDGTPCVVKILKPVRLGKINREIRILEALKEGPNISTLYDVVRDQESQTISLILEWVNNTDFRTLYPQFSTNDVATYIYKILQALDYAHQKGIMHRDIKPQNIMYDQQNQKVRLIDWGLADYYVPGTSYPVRVATRHYKGPELLLGYSQYDTSLDIWSLGCTFATILFRRSPFFRGRDNEELLIKIVDALGSKEFEEYIEKYKITVPPALMTKIRGHQRKSWDHWKKDDNASLLTPDALDLLSKMLVVDHSQRISAHDALNHPFFDPVRDYCEHDSQKY